METKELKVKCPNCGATDHIKVYEVQRGLACHCLWCNHRWIIDIDKEKQKIEEKLKEQGYSEEVVKKILVWYT
jgi:Zn ribbon nucleic-acid-binding protein